MPQRGKGQLDHARGARIQRLREMRGLSGPQAARRVGVSYRGYQFWEEGRGISPGKLVKLAEVLRSTPEYVAFGETGLPHTSEGIARLETRLAELEQEVRRARHGGPLPARVLAQLDQVLEELRRANDDEAPPLPPRADGPEDPPPPE